MKTINIKGTDYIGVNERLKEFRTNPKYKGYSLETDIIQLENGVCTMKATIKDDASRVIATGYAQEKENSSFINKTSYIENCETSAWGRALGNLGIGIDTSIASAEEVLNAMQNQKPQAPAKPQEKELDADIDLLEELKNKKDMSNLVKFYNDNKAKAKNQMKFTQEFQKLRATINKKEVK